MSACLLIAAAAATLLWIRVMVSMLAMEATPLPSSDSCKHDKSHACEKSQVFALLPTRLTNSSSKQGDTYMNSFIKHSEYPDQQCSITDSRFIITICDDYGVTDPVSWQTV